jgi:Transglutaminase-like superfamily
MSMERLQLTQAWWAMRVVMWLCVLPLRLHRHTLPELLERLTPRYPRPQRSAPQEREMAVRIVTRLCRLRCFQGRFFPRLCLRQSLTLYYVLARLGEPVALHLGVSKNGETLRGHSWVTVQGEPVAERAPPEEACRPLYRFACTDTGTAGKGGVKVKSLRRGGRHDAKPGTECGFTTGRR